jgi:hypothetical protein
MDIPKKGWFIRKPVDKHAHMSEIYLNGERLRCVQQVRIGLDADFPLVTLELKLAGIPLQVEILQPEIRPDALPPMEIKEEEPCERMSGQEAGDLLAAALDASKQAGI